MAVATMSMHDLVQTIDSRSAQIQQYLSSSNLPQPSLGVDGPLPDYVPVEAVEIQLARAELREASQMLAALAAGPKRHLYDITQYGHHDSNALRILYTWEIPKKVPLEGTISYKELAQATGLEEDALTRAVRYALTLHVLTEPQPGHVAHSAISKLLITDEASWAWLGHTTASGFPAVAKKVDAMQKWPGSRAPTETGFQLAFDTDLTPFQYGEKVKKGKSAQIARAMDFVSTYGGEYSVDGIITGYDWKSLGKALVVDLGGSNGTKGISIARANPDLQVIVQDLPKTVASAPPIPDDVKDRVKFQEHDFFTPQPLRDPDVFFMARCFHDWPDAQCCEILGNLVPYMKSGARLIIDENILLPPGRGSLLTQRLTRVLDMQMMCALNARERTLENWLALVEEGGKGQLKFEKAGGRILSFVKN